MVEARRVVIVGVPGVGKTTVITSLLESLRRVGADVKHVVFGSVMFAEAQKRHGVKHRDEIRALSVSDQRQLQVLAARTISKTKASVLIIDTHLFINTREGYWPGLPLEVLDPLSPTNVVLVEASPSEILTRRLKDKSRYRETTSEHEVMRELELARTMLATSAVLTGAPLLTVSNKEGHAEDAAERIASSIGFR